MHFRSQPWLAFYTKLSVKSLSGMWCSQKQRRARHWSIVSRRVGCIPTIYMWTTSSHHLSTIHLQSGSCPTEILPFILKPAACWGLWSKSSNVFLSAESFVQTCHWSLLLSSCAWSSIPGRILSFLLWPDDRLVNYTVRIRHRRRASRLLHPIQKMGSRAHVMDNFSKNMLIVFPRQVSMVRLSISMSILCSTFDWRKLCGLILVRTFHLARRFISKLLSQILSVYTMWFSLAVTSLPTCAKWIS